MKNAVKHYFGGYKYIDGILVAGLWYFSFRLKKWCFLRH